MIEEKRRSEFDSSVESKLAKAHSVAQSPYLMERDLADERRTRDQEASVGRRSVTTSLSSRWQRKQE